MNILVYGLSNNWGGIEAIVCSLIKHFNNKINVDIILPEGDCLYINSIPENVNRMHCTSWGRHPIRFARQLKKIVLEKDYDYVWINAAVMSNYTLVKVIKRYSGAKIIAHSHGTNFEEKNRFKYLILLFLHQLNRKKYIKNTDLHWACSTKSAEWFYGTNFVRESVIHIVRNGVDLEKYKYNPTIRMKYRDELSVSDKTVWLHVGRLTLVKNQFYLLDVFCEYLRLDKEAVLLIVGAGELLDALKAHTLKLQISENVKFLGFRRDVCDLMLASDCFILPSLHEGFPVVLIEAQATGLASIVSSEISREVAVTELVSFISCKMTPIYWAKEIFAQKTSFQLREISYEKVLCEYNLTSVVSEIERILFNR